MSRHVVVIGAGVIGLWSALCCVERGFRVTLVERNGERRDGCSYGNTGLVVPSHFVPLAAPGVLRQGLAWLLDRGAPFRIRARPSLELLRWLLTFARSASAAHVTRAAPLLSELLLASRECYEAFAYKHACAFRRSGALMLCRSRHGLDEEARTAEQANALGLEAEVWDARAAAEREPGVRMDILGAVHYPGDGSVVPQALIAELQSRLAETVRFIWNIETIGWRLENGRIHSARTPDGEIEGDEFVLAAGAWSAALCRSLGIRMPLQAGKGYSLTLAQPRQLPSMPALLTEARVAVSPLAGELRFGGTMEIGGTDHGVDPIRVRSIVDAVPRYYPDFAPGDFAGVRAWHGLRPCSPDGLPYLGRSRRRANLIVATGHAMLGVSLAPITGRLVAQTIAGERTDIDLVALAPERFD